MSFIDEFKKFAIKGNAIDLAVGVVIGASFNKIVTALVEDIIMPPVSILTGNIQLEDKAFVLKGATETTEAIVFKYGHFIDVVVEFLIIAFSVFIMVKWMNRLRDEQDEKEASEGQGA